MKRGVLWAGVVYLVQIPILVGCVAGLIPLHPIVILLPLVGLLNGKVEGKGREGLGLVIVRPGRSLLLALLFAALCFGGSLIVFGLEDVPLQPPPLTAETIWSLIGEFAVDVFIIALFEEVVNRGYIQTRLQAVWGFWGVIVATLLFASLHLPSAFLDFGYDLSTALAYFVLTGLAGFMLGYVYWRTGSVLTTIAIHGLRNFAWGVSLRLGGVTAARMHVSQTAFQLLWLLAQVGLMLLLCRALFSEPRSGMMRLRQH